MRSENWDSKKQQGDLLMRYFVIKYVEQLRQYVESLSEFIPTHDGKRVKKLIEEVEKSIEKTNVILEKVPKTVNEDMWENSLTCVGCLHSFANRSDLLDHIRLHLVKLGVLPDWIKRDSKEYHD